MSRQFPSLLKLCVNVIVKTTDQATKNRLCAPSSVPSKLADIVSYQALNDRRTIDDEFCRVYFNVNVSKLNLQHRRAQCDYSILLHHAIHFCPTLSELYIPGWRDSESLIKAMQQIQCIQLKRLDISGIVINIPWTSILRQLPYLEQVKANGTEFFDDECIKTLVLQDGNESFHERELAHDSAIQNHVSGQADGAGQNLTLTLLHVSGNGVTHKSLAYLERCPRLTNLNFAGKSLLDDRAIARLSKCQNLNSIDLTSCTGISSEALVDFCLTHTRLTDVNLSSNRHLTLDNILQIAQGLQEPLQRLSLCWHKNITTADALHVINLCSNLRYLNLIGCHKVDVGQISEHFSHLTYLTIVGFKKGEKKPKE